MIYVVLGNLVINLIILSVEIIIGIKERYIAWRKRRQEKKY